MKTINETFTDEEYAQLMRVKKHIKMSWHDLLLDVFAKSEANLIKILKEEGKTDEEIKTLFGSDNCFIAKTMKENERNLREEYEI